MWIMKNQLSFLLSLLLLHFSTTLAQSPAAAPAPAAPPNIIKILTKASQFTLFLRLLQATNLADTLNHELTDANVGLTIFAPTDNAFSSLRSGTLNALTDQDKLELVQFHVVPTFISMSQFQTVSNPIRTNAGDAGSGRFPFNVTTSGSSVNITTGLTNTSVSGTVYSDGQLAVYQVDKVLLPLDIFTPKPPPPPAPAPAKPKKKSDEAVSPVEGNGALRISFNVQNLVVFGVGISTMVGVFCL